MSAPSFAWSSANPLSKTLKCIARLSENIFFKLNSGFWMAVTFQGWSSSGQPSKSITPENIEKMWEFIHRDHHWTINGLTDTTGKRQRREIHSTACTWWQIDMVWG
jgi:hypothetical protein